MRLDVLEAGMSWVQDLGRYGSEFGLPVGGSEDQYSATCANALVGNQLTDPTIEVVASALAFTADADFLMAVTGAAGDVSIDAIQLSQWTPTVVYAGQTVRIGTPRVGVRAYLAIRGRIAAPLLLGSVAPDSGLGSGVILRAGDSLDVSIPHEVFDHPLTRIPVFRPAVKPLPLGPPWVIRVLAGPHWSVCAGDSGWLFDGTYSITYPSSPVGLRLSGSTPQVRTPEMLSRGVPIGAIEMPRDGGGLIVLLRGRMLTAGYPIPAVAATVDHPLLGQIGPSDVVRFELIGRGQALALLRVQRATVRDLAMRVRRLLHSSGIAAR